MKIDDFYVENKKEINALSKVKLNISKELEKLLLSKPTNGHTEYYSIIQMWRGKIIERVFAVRTFRGKPEIQEVIRRIEGNKKILVKNMYFSQMCGYRCVWSNTKPSYYLFDLKREYNEWLYSNIAYYNVFTYQLFTFDDLIKLDDTLKYCNWKGEPIIEYITMYRKCPEIEILSKLGYKRLRYNTAVLKKLKDKKFVKFLWKERGNDNIKNVTGKIVLKAYKHNLSIDETYMLDSTERSFRNYDFKKDYPMLDIEKTKKYLIRNKVSLSSYCDLLEALMYFKLDLTDTKNSYPKDFQYWHDYYINQMETDKNKDIDIKIKEQANKYKRILKPINDEIKMLFPNCTLDFINEGEALNHCVGRMGYNKKMANGESLIIFVRKEEDKPLYTMEYDPKGKKIKQLYGDHDTQPEQSIKDIIYNVWLPKVKRMRFA